MGLPKRDGTKLDMDMRMFRMLDTNGDGRINLEEFEENLPDEVRAKLEEKLDAGWTFDAEKWSGRQQVRGGTRTRECVMRGGTLDAQVCVRGT